MSKRKIMFVCGMNMDRSPVAECLFNNLSDDSPFEAFSRAALFGGEVHHEGLGNSGLRFLAKHSSDLAEFVSNHHRAKGYTQKDLNSAEVILTMEESHKEELLEARPDIAYKVFTLKEYLGETESIDVPDYWDSNEIPELTQRLYLKLTSEL